MPQPDHENDTLSVLYYSAETPASVLKENLKSFGWSQPHPDCFRIVGAEELDYLDKVKQLFSPTPNSTVEPTRDPPFNNIVVFDSINVMKSQINEHRHEKPHSEDVLENQARSTDEFSFLRSIQNNLKGRCWILILMEDWEHDIGQDFSVCLRC